MIHASTIRCSFLALAALFTLPAPVGAAAESELSRYSATMSRYAALAPEEQAVWLAELFTQRSQPACRVVLDTPQYERVVADEQEVVERVQRGEELTAGELLDLLVQVDRQETEAIHKLAAEYQRATHEAVGTNLYDYQQRLKLWQAIREQCEYSPDPFDGQPLLLWWLHDAITQQRISAAPPMPPVPNFADDREEPWRRATWQHVPQVQTSFRVEETGVTMTSIVPQIEKYNASLAELAGQLYDPTILSVDELNRAVDSIASLSLVRIALAANMLKLPVDQRQSLPEIESVDAALSLARVKVSAARRQILRQAEHDTSDQQWEELKGLNRVLVRLDMLTNGPDAPPSWQDPASLVPRR